MRYSMCYTFDCVKVTDFLGRPISGDDWRKLVSDHPSSDYMRYIIDTETGEIVWQSNKSARFGDIGVIN